MIPNVFSYPALVVASLGGLASALENRAGHGSPHMTLVVQNRHHKPIIMSDDTYTLMPKDPTLAPGEHKIFKTGPWSGNFKVNEKKEGNTGQDTLVEFTVNDQGITVDVSYVAAFTVPAVCGCRSHGGKNVTLVTGCNIDLKKLNGGSCPPENHNGHGGCMNPMRNRPWHLGASSFFKPCEGAGYTHEGDHMTTQNAEACREGPIVCCIGDECPPSIKQKTFNGTAHDRYANRTRVGVFASSYNYTHSESNGTFLSLGDVLDLVH